MPRFSPHTQAVVNDVATEIRNFATTAFRSHQMQAMTGTPNQTDLLMAQMILQSALSPKIDAHRVRIINGAVFEVVSKHLSNAADEGEFIVKVGTELNLPSIGLSDAASVPGGGAAPRSGGNGGRSR